MATCTECGGPKPIGHGFRQCSDLCRRKAKNRKGKAWRQKMKLKVAEHKVSLGCTRCGYNKCGAALDWHHPEENKERRLTVKSYFTPLGIAERNKCILLCANCHREEHEDKKIQENGDVYV